MRGRGFLTAAFLLLIVILWAGCAGPSQDRRSDADTQTQDRSASGADVELDKQVYVDVYGSGGDDWRDPWQPDIKPPARFDLSAGDDDSTPTAAEDSLRMVQGFRLQLADVLEHGIASEIQDRALAWFDHVYVTFRSPNYKIRAGNYQTRAEAVAKLQVARDHGFRDAWIVPDWVFENPPPPMRTAVDSLAVDAETLAPQPTDVPE
ncbi:hypothetical protein KQI52_11610 [bacterium]|nr:hypothetical protein [bacterium]